MEDPFSIVSPKLPTSARVAGFSAYEALSRPYEVEVVVVAPSEELEPDGVIGADAALLVKPSGSGDPMRFAGSIAAFDLLHDDADGRAVARAVIVPSLWFLRFARRSRVFTEVSVVDVIDAVLAEHGVTRVDKRLGSYAAEAHICQYHESDFDFLSRWMEREGIFYWFEHGEAGETLVLADSASYSDDPLGGTVPYIARTRGPGSQDTLPPCLSVFKRRHVALPSSVGVRDYDYAKPDLAVSGSVQVSSMGRGTVSFHGERVFDPDASTRIATRRAEELQAREVVFQAEGRRMHLRPGATFQLEGHPRPAFNAEYLTIEARHTGRLLALQAIVEQYADLPADETYRVELEAIPGEKIFRPASRAPWPRIDGFERGIIDGPADSDYAQLDDQGRYAVKLGFDESDLKDGKATTWIRMMQPHGGAPEGFHFPQRKGTEVVVAFLGGDPDRPVIAGVVPNAQTPSPVTSANKTLNVIQTGALNRFELDDEAGKERIALSTPYADTFLWMGNPLEEDELQLHTSKNGFVDIGERLTVDVGVEAGKGDFLLTVRDSWVSSVEKGRFELTVVEGEHLTTVAKDTTLTVGGSWITSITADSTHTVGGNWSGTVKGDSTYVVETGNTSIDTKVGTTDIHSNQTISIKSNVGDVNIEGVNVNTNATGDSSWLTLGNETGVTIGNSATIAIGDSIGLKIGGDLEMHLGAAASLCLDDKLDVTLAPIAIDIFGGMKAELEMALALVINASLTLEFGVFKFEMQGGKLSQKPMSVELNGCSVIA